MAVRKTSPKLVVDNRDPEYDLDGYGPTDKERPPHRVMPVRFSKSILKYLEPKKGGYHPLKGQKLAKTHRESKVAIYKKKTPENKLDYKDANTHLENRGGVGVTPAHMEYDGWCLACVDLDGGGMKGRKALEEKFGPPVCWLNTFTPKRAHGYWFVDQPSVDWSYSVEIDGTTVSGEVKSESGYVVLCDPKGLRDGLVRARKSGKSAVLLLEMRKVLPPAGSTAQVGTGFGKYHFAESNNSLAAKLAAWPGEEGTRRPVMKDIMISCARRGNKELLELAKEKFRKVFPDLEDREKQIENFIAIGEKLKNEAREVWASADKKDDPGKVEWALAECGLELRTLVSLGDLGGDGHRQTRGTTGEGHSEEWVRVTEGWRAFAREKVCGVLEKSVGINEFRNKCDAVFYKNKERPMWKWINDVRVRREKTIAEDMELAENFLNDMFDCECPKLARFASGYMGAFLAAPIVDPKNWVAKELFGIVLMGDSEIGKTKIWSHLFPAEFQYLHRHGFTFNDNSEVENAIAYHGASLIEWGEQAGGKAAANKRKNWMTQTDYGAVRFKYERETSSDQLRTAMTILTCNEPCLTNDPADLRRWLHLSVDRKPREKGDNRKPNGPMFDWMDENMEALWNGFWGLYEEGGIPEMPEKLKKTQMREAVKSVQQSDMLDMIKDKYEQAVEHTKKGSTRGFVGIESAEDDDAPPDLRVMTTKDLDINPMTTTEWALVLGNMTKYEVKQKKHMYKARSTKWGEMPYEDFKEQMKDMGFVEMYAKDKEGDGARRWCPTQRLPWFEEVGLKAVTLHRRKPRKHKRR